MQISRNHVGEPVEIFMRKGDDMHQHVRQGDILQIVAPMVAKRFGRAIIMPNTIPPITRESHLPAYWSEITSAAPNLTPLMTMYLTDTLNPAEVARCLANRTMVGVKYYPRGLTTNSDSGVADPSVLWTSGTKPYEVLRVLAEHGAVLLLHAADGFATAHWDNQGRYYSPGDELDPFDQEAHFICCTLPRIRDAHPTLKISLEHLSTDIGVAYMEAHGGDTLGCSVTAHHLLLDRRDMFRGGFRPHKMWWPIIQSMEHKEALRQFIAEGYPFVWLGSDSAPHQLNKKEAECCVGGVLMAHAGIELYVEAFEDIGCLEKLEDFASVNGARFYGLEPNTEEIRLVREPWKVSEFFYSGQEPVRPFRLGETVRWKLVD